MQIRSGKRELKTGKKRETRLNVEWRWRWGIYAKSRMPGHKK